jgi:alanine racemase
MIRKALQAAGWWLAHGATQRIQYDKSLEPLLHRIANIEASLRVVANANRAGMEPKPEPIPDGAHAARVDGVPPFYMFTHPPGQDQYISHEIIEEGTWESFETEIARRLLQHFELFIDIGANIGWYSVVAQRVMRSGSAIYAFEPDPRNFSLLLKNTEQATEIRTIAVPAAVSDQIGTARLFNSETNMGIISFIMGLRTDSLRRSR